MGWCLGHLIVAVGTRARHPGELLRLHRLQATDVDRVLPPGEVAVVRLALRVLEDREVIVRPRHATIEPLLVDRGQRERLTLRAEDEGVDRLRSRLVGPTRLVDEGSDQAIPAELQIDEHLPDAREAYVADDLPTGVGLVARPLQPIGVDTLVNSFLALTRFDFLVVTVDDLDLRALGLVVRRIEPQPDLLRRLAEHFLGRLLHRVH